MSRGCRHDTSAAAAAPGLPGRLLDSALSAVFFGIALTGLLVWLLSLRG
ncbi:MAG: hypothetical protein Q8Q80_07860 [Methyloversatilis sp.]|nr:hypothetical protein [Methyloversatilis sp.]MDP3872563.1 hypothetical protein [Methyloversatilis sp.]